MNKLYTSKYGINILQDNMIKLDRDISDFKIEGNKMLKNKKYKNLLLSISNGDIISILLCYVIPYCIKFDNINNQNIVSLVEKIGKEIEKIYYKVE
jgi:hypothetical protein